MRISSALLLALALAACGAEPERDDRTRITCAVASSDFTDDCTVEQVVSADGTVLTIRHADGGFRRLQIADDGRGVVTADGAETAVVTPIAGGLIEVRVGDVRYHLPATVKQ